MRLPGARRLVRSVALAFVAAILLGAAVGATNGSEAQAKPMVAVPVPQLGDRATYSLSIDESYGVGPDGTRGSFRFLDFEWAAGHEVRAGDGLVHATDLVRTSGWQFQSMAASYNKLVDQGTLSGPKMPLWVHHNDTLFLEQGTMDVLATDTDYHSVQYDNSTVPQLDAFGAGSGTKVPLLEPIHATQVMDGQLRSFAHNQDCILLDPFQGRTVELGQKVSFPDVCDLHGLFLAFGSDSYTAAALDSVHGVPAMRMEPTTPSNLDLGFSGLHMGGNVRFWLANGIPYPVRVAWTSSGQEITTVLELTGYEAGATPRATGPAPHSPAPAFQLVDVKPWGLEETGVKHPFPMSEAFRGARDDPGFTSLRNYLGAHPDAYMAQTNYGIEATEKGLKRTWLFTVTDGDTWLQVTATRTSAPPASLVPLSPPFQVPGATTANTTYSAPLGVQSPSKYVPSYYPLPSEAPDQLPTVGSMLARWQEYASPERIDSEKAWGFQIVCLRIVSKECRAIFVTGYAGSVDATAGKTEPDTSTTPPTLRASGTTHGSILFFSDNATLGFMEATIVGEQKTGVGDTPPTPFTAGSAPSRPTIRPASSLAAWVPTPQQSAGVAAAALTVGALYYLWPLAKGTIGLFSRLKQPEVLGHPARQQLLQLIEAEPGIHFKEMARRTGLPNGSLVHHLETLRRSGQVVARPSGGYTLYFLGAHVPAGSAEAASALKADGARRILDIVRQQPGLSSADVAARSGLQPSTVTYHVQRLQAAGLLTGLRDGRAVRLHPVEASSAV